MRKLLPLIMIVFFSCKDDVSLRPAPAPAPGKPSELSLLRRSFDQKIDSLLPLSRSFTRANDYNREIVFIADLSLHSGLERFAVVDLTKDSVLHNGLVAHGVGGKEWSEQAKYSNVPNSLCSSPGKYKIGMRYNGSFGKAYKLYGLDASNSRAYERFIVLHGYDCVPDAMVYPQHLCNSQGCPMVSYKFLDILSGYIDKSNRPVLLWIVG